MKKIVTFMIIVSVLFSLAAEGQSEAKTDWPTGSVQFVVPAKAGGGTDAAARVISKALQEAVGSPFVVVNQPSGGGSVACEQVRNAKPDGNTILFYHSSMFANYHTGLYDHSPSEDFTTCVVMPVAGSYALVVGADSPYTSVQELVAASKANPDKVTLGVQLKGSSHFMSGLLAQDSGSQFRVVEAGSDADKLVAVQGGSIDAAFVNTPGALQYQEAGKLRVLATIASFPERDPNAPDIPSFVELGYENTMYGLDFFILGPKDMSGEVAAKVNAAFKTVLSDQAIIDQLAKMRMPISWLSLEDSAKRLAEGDKKIGTTAAMLGLK